MIIPYYCEDYPEDPPEYRPLDEKKTLSPSGIQPPAGKSALSSSESSGQKTSASGISQSALSSGVDSIGE